MIIVSFAGNWPVTEGLFPDGDPKRKAMYRRQENIFQQHCRTMPLEVLQLQK